MWKSTRSLRSTSKIKFVIFSKLSPLQVPGSEQLGRKIIWKMKGRKKSFLPKIKSPWNTPCLERIAFVLPIRKLNVHSWGKTWIFIVVLIICHIVDICSISYSLRTSKLKFYWEFSIPFFFFFDSDLFGFSLNIKNVFWAFD